MPFAFPSNLGSSFGKEGIIKCLLAICIAVAFCIGFYFFGHRMPIVSVNKLNGKYMSLIRDLELMAIKAQKEDPGANPEDDSKAVLSDLDVPLGLHAMVNYSADFAAETVRLFTPRQGVNGKGHPVILFPYGEWLMAYHKIGGNQSDHFDEMDVYFRLVLPQLSSEQLQLKGLDLVYNLGGKAKGNCNSFSRNGKENCLSFGFLRLPNATRTTYMINVPPTYKGIKRVVVLQEVFLSNHPSAILSLLEKDEVARLFPM